LEVKRKHEFDQCQVRQDILSLSSTGYPIYPLSPQQDILFILSITGYPIYPLNNRISYLSFLSSTGYPITLSTTGYPLYPLNKRISVLSTTGYPIYPLYGYFFTFCIFHYIWFVIYHSSRFLTNMVFIQSFRNTIQRC